MKFSINSKVEDDRAVESNILEGQHRRALEIYLLLLPKLRMFPGADAAIVSWEPGFIYFRLVFKLDERVELKIMSFNSDEPKESARKILRSVAEAIAEYAHEGIDLNEKLLNHAKELHEALEA
jgi:hypothetical protein